MTTLLVGTIVFQSLLIGAGCLVVMAVELGASRRERKRLLDLALVQASPDTGKAITAIQAANESADPMKEPFVSPKAPDEILAQPGQII